MPNPMIDTRQLRHVALLVKHRNFGRAAGALFISQPALTKSIRNLENLLGVPLFDRQPHDVSPTAYCDVLMEHAHQVFVELESIHHKLDQMSKLQRGELRIGSGPLVAEALVADAVSRLLRQHPQLKIHITIDSWYTLARMLRQGDIHLFIGDVEELKDQPDLIIEELPTTSSIFACRPEHPLANASKLTPEDLLEYPLAIPALPQRYVNWFMENAPEGIDPEVYYQHISRITCESYGVLRNIARNTNYITSGIEILFREEISNGLLVPLVLEGFSEIETCAGTVYLKNRTLPPSGMALIESLS